MIRGKDAEGVAAIIHGVSLFVQAVGCEEDIHAVASGAMVFRAEVHYLVCYEDEAEDLGAEFVGKVEEAEGLAGLGRGGDVQVI